jgi:hypothetical protein
MRRWMLEQGDTVRGRGRLAPVAAVVLVVLAAVWVVPALAEGGAPAPGASATPVVSPADISPDVVARAALLKPMDLSTSPLEKGLTSWELAVVDKLEQAAVFMDQAYWQQVAPDKLPIFQALAGATGEP